MPKACSVCTHAERSTIDQDLADGQSYRTIEHTRGVSKSALLRHQQHQAPQAHQETGHIADQAPQPCSCPCLHLDWHALAHDAQQCSEFVQQAQTQDEALHYLRFYLLRFAALIASARESFGSFVPYKASAPRHKCYDAPALS